MADLPLTATIGQVPALSAVSPDAQMLVEEPNGPTGRISLKQLLGRLISTEEATETAADLARLLDYDENSIALVFADPDIMTNGWYRKVGANGAGSWQQFETLAKATRDSLILLSGHGAPDPALGSVSQFYRDLDAETEYGPKTVAGWGAPRQLRGDTGPANSTFATNVLLRSAPPANLSAILTAALGSGIFRWSEFNHAADVAIDTAFGIYVPPMSDPSGASGAFVRMWNGDVSPMWFGAAGDNVADDSAALAMAGAMATRLGRYIDLTEASVSWRIASEVDWTSIPGLKAVFDRSINVDVTGNYPRGFGVLFGNPGTAAAPVSGTAGRSDKLQLLGNLSVLASARTTALGGVYMKGSFMAISAIYVNGFNGSGLRIDSVWDSEIGRLSIQGCGNLTTYAVLIASFGDTTNATSIQSLQCEQAFQKGIFANLLRYEIHNIHAERLAILSTNENGSGTYNNHYFLVSQTTIGQAILDAIPAGTLAPDGSTALTSRLKITTSGSVSAFQEFAAGDADVVADYGDQLTFRTLGVASFTQSGADHVELLNPQISGVCSAEHGLTVIGGSLGTFLPTYNGRDQLVLGTAIAQPINFINHVLGNIVLRDCAFAAAVLSTGDAPQPGYRKVLLDNCSGPALTGAYNSVGRIRGGRYATASIASQAVLELDGVDFDTFGDNGNKAYLSRNCRAANVNGWSLPLNMAYPAGTRTERIGYAAGVNSFYQQTDTSVGGGTTWAAVA